jgi:hypothetical protein
MLSEPRRILHALPSDSYRELTSISRFARLAKDHQIRSVAYPPI